MRFHITFGMLPSVGGFHQGQNEGLERNDFITTASKPDGVSKLPFFSSDQDRSVPASEP